MKIYLLTFSFLSVFAQGETNLRGNTAPKRQPKSIDPSKLFNILTSNNDILVGDLRDDIPYSMPHNVEICRESFAQEDQSAEFLTNPSSLPDVHVPGYSYVQYSADSMYAKSMQKTVDRADDLFENLLEAGFIDALTFPSVMFDIDNTMTYTAFNDTDNVGDAPPIVETVEFINKWCSGWGSGDKAILNCVFITARFCTEMNAKATSRWLKTTFDASDELIASNVQFSGNLECSCCDQGNIAFKDILRKDWMDTQGAQWLASIGDQYTDSVGRYSGIRIKLPNVWFDSSAVPNQYTMGTRPTLVDGIVPPEEWSTQCSTENHAPIVPGPIECLNPSSLRVARENTSFEYCLSQTEERSPNQQFGCSIDISTGETDCDWINKYSG